MRIKVTSSSMPVKAANSDSLTRAARDISSPAHSGFHQSRNFALDRDRQVAHQAPCTLPNPVLAIGIERRSNQVLERAPALLIYAGPHGGRAMLVRNERQIEVAPAFVPDSLQSAAGRIIGLPTPERTANEFGVAVATVSIADPTTPSNACIWVAVMRMSSGSRYW